MIKKGRESTSQFVSVTSIITKLNQHIIAVRNLNRIALKA